jgi:cytochrome c-type biogenesis protein CcmH
MKYMLRSLFALTLLAGMTLLNPAAKAVEPDELLQNPQLESRARDISAGLRCLVCQNQSIDDSNAGLAKDLRILVRERLTKGDDDDQVVDFVVARYGEFVLLKPRFSPHNYILWFGPAALLALGIFMARGAVRKSKIKVEEAASEPQGLSADEEARLNDILGKNKS